MTPETANPLISSGSPQVLRCRTVSGGAGKTHSAGGPCSQPSPGRVIFARGTVGGSGGSGEGGIRTLEAGISPPNALAGRRLQPLGHFSGRAHPSVGPCRASPRARVLCAPARRGGRAVECGGLENRYRRFRRSRVQIPPPPLVKPKPPLKRGFCLGDRQGGPGKGSLAEHHLRRLDQHDHVIARSERELLGASARDRRDDSRRDTRASATGNGVRRQ